MIARTARRIVLAAVVVAQLVTAVRGYDDPHRVLAFQMFRESSTWQAEILRVTPGGERVDVRDGWPGGYRWSELVRGQGLTHPFAPHHASSGLDSTLDFLQGALDWVAANTPRDTETVRLVAEVTVWHNGRGPRQVTLVSADREIAARPDREAAP